LSELCGVWQSSRGTQPPIECIGRSG
jgi:hypothetical protein